MDYKRYNFAANVTSQLTSWMKLKVNTKFMHSDQNTPFGDGGISEGFYHSLAPSHSFSGRPERSFHGTDNDSLSAERNLYKYTA